MLKKIWICDCCGEYESENVHDWAYNEEKESYIGEGGLAICEDCWEKYMERKVGIYYETDTTGGEKGKFYAFPMVFEDKNAYEYFEIEKLKIVAVEKVKDIKIEERGYPNLSKFFLASMFDSWPIAVQVESKEYYLREEDDLNEY